MSRATAMTPEDRRKAITDAVAPLLLERGTSLTTRQLAEAAGVAEGTLFRVFESKQELIAAAALAALEAEPALNQLAELPDEQTLTERVTSILEIVQLEIRRTRSLLMAAFHREGTGPPPGHHRKPFHHERQQRVTDAITRGLQEYAGQLTVPPRTAAGVLQAMAFASTFHFADTSALTEPSDVADVVLHGIALGTT
ncbi:MAG: TetR/AcrR family transcriptional regulator [Propionibacteriaceae bacterium]|nr:TetR/AcrR family transcriptional regulator [Propionibacteriaceae bacterium]